MYYDIPASLREGGRSPWGTIQWAEGLAEGIVQVGTAGHGGVHLNAERNRTMPSMFRNANGWYEEDCERHMVILAHQESFDASDIASAHAAVKRWWPNKYEQWLASGGKVVAVENEG